MPSRVPERMTLKEQVLEAARWLPVPARRAQRKPWVDAAMIAAAAAVLTAALWFSGGTPHAASRPPEVALWIVGGTALLAAAVTALALPRARSMLPRSRGELVAAMIGAPVLIGLWIVFGHRAYTDPFVRTGLRCFALTALTAPWPFAALVRLRWRPDPVHPALTGGALGAAAGAWSAVMVELWCPIASAEHVAKGHVAPFVLLVAAGALAGRFLFRLPRREEVSCVPPR